VADGIGVVPCVNGQLQTGHCKVVACNAGYHAMPNPKGSVVDAACLPCMIGEWSPQNEVDLSLTSPLSTSCLICNNAPAEVTVYLTDATGVSSPLTCNTRYDLGGWDHVLCPYETVCPASQIPGASVSGDEKKAAVVVLAVLLALTGTMAAGLGWYVIRQQRVRTEKESLGLLGHSRTEPL